MSRRKEGQVQQKILQTCTTYQARCRDQYLGSYKTEEDGWEAVNAYLKDGSIIAKRKIKVRPRRTLEQAIFRTWYGAKYRAEDLGRDFDLTSDDIWYLWMTQGGKCALTGVDLEHTQRNPNTLSLDRIDSSKGYVRGNIQLITTICNRSKGDMSLNQFISMCQQVISTRTANVYGHAYSIEGEECTETEVCWPCDNDSAGG